MAARIIIGTTKNDLSYRTFVNHIVDIVYAITQNNIPMADGSNYYYI